MRISTKFAVLVSTIILSLVLTACGGNAPASGGGGDAPAKAAKDFLNAAYTGGDVKPLVCSALTATADQMAKGFSSVTAGGAKVSMDKLTFTASEVKDNAATVTVGGKLSVTVAGQTVDQDMTGKEFKIPVKNEGGAWKVCV